MSPSPDAITLWIERLKANDPQAASVLWEQFASRLLAAARTRLRDAPCRVADEDDVAVSAFTSFLQAVRQGRVPRLDSRDDLWAVLLTIVRRKAANQLRTAARRPMRGDSALQGDDGIALEPAAGGLPPDEAVVVQDEVRRLLEALDDGLRRIAMWKMEGLTHAEIAGRLGCAVPTVERRWREVRLTWLTLEADLAESG
jgi:DNA-directed RNA polymerase specialized sigma24 family protein